MKRIILAVLMITTVAFSYAQKGLKFGVFGGGQWSMLINKEDSDNPFEYTDYLIKARGAFGISFDYHFADKAGVGTEFLFSWQGQAYGDGSQQNINYFKLPILINFNSNPKSIVMFMGRVGPQFAFLMKAKKTGLNVLGISLPVEDVENTEYFKNFVFGVVLGFDLGFNIGPWVTPYLGIRLDYMVTDAIKSDELTATLTGNTTDPKKKYNYQSVEGFAVDPSSGNRSVSNNAAILFEIGVNINLRKDKNMKR